MVSFVFYKTNDGLKLQDKIEKVLKIHLQDGGIGFVQGKYQMFLELKGRVT